MQYDYTKILINCQVFFLYTFSKKLLTISENMI